MEITPALAHRNADTASSEQRTKCRTSRPAHCAPLLRAAAASCTVLLAASCASLPEVRYIDDSPISAAMPTVANAQGNMSTKKSAALMAPRWRSQGISHADVLEVAAREELATGSSLITGNKVTLLHDGPQTMAAMSDAIGKARHHIHLETYIFEQDELGLQFADLLIARQRSGVQVSIIYDSVGTLGTSQAFFEKMRDAGILLIAFNPVNPLKMTGPWQLNHRDHRKILIVDGTVAFTGGVNISGAYATSSLFRSGGRRNAKIGWRDTHIQIEGPAVAALQTVFLDNWTKQHGPLLVDRTFFPPLAEAGNKLVRVLASEPGGHHEIYKAYMLAIEGAQQTIHITSAYFVPDAQILQALMAAARRGVEVKLILPGVTDSDLVFYAAQSFYSEMLASGIKIYQLQIAVLHAKTAVIDKVWATVGSTNIDTRSFLHNNEINVVVMDTEFGDAMEKAFTEDLRNAAEITADKWQERSVSARLREWAARRIAYWL
jgi:cardiolipin synthase A/B